MTDDLIEVETGSEVDERSPRHPQRIRTAALITAFVGIAHSVLLLLAFAIISSFVPRIGASDQEFVDFYTNSGQRRAVLYAGIMIIPFAGIAYIWFTVSLRMWLLGTVNRLNQLLANLVLVCGIIYVTLLFCAGAAISLVAIEPASGTSEAAISLGRQFPQYGGSLFLIFAMRMAAMTVFAISNIGREEETLPRWFLMTGFPLGIVLLITASVNPWLVVLFPAWLTTLCILIVIRIRPSRNSAIPSEPAPVN